MTKVLFCHGAPERLQAAATWLALHAAPGQSLQATLVYAPDQELAERFDRMLWTHPATGFLPHCRIDSPLAGETSSNVTNRRSLMPYELVPKTEPKMKTPRMRPSRTFPPKPPPIPRPEKPPSPPGFTWRWRQ